MPTANFENLLKTADMFNEWTRKAVSTDRGLHAETLIISQARMAGTLMYMSFGLGNSFAPGTVVLSPRANIDGPKLMNVMIATLRQLGHKDFAEQDVNITYRYQDSIQIDLKRTHEILGLFFQRWIEAVGGTSYFDGATAAAIATAICIHDCRDVLDIRKGAGIAIAGFVEGVKTAPFPFVPESNPTPDSQVEKTQQGLTSADRFFAIAKAYRENLKAAYDNLAIVKRVVEAGEPKDTLSADCISKMSVFRLENATRYFATREGEKGTSYIFGDIDERGGFYPSITEMILKIHSVANMVNATIDGRVSIPSGTFARSLQEVLMDSFFLAKTFLFYSTKASTTDGKIQIPEKDKGGEQPSLETFLNSFFSDLPKITKSCVDLDHVNQKVRGYRFKNYAWITYKVDSDGRNVNGYYLPRKYWEPFVEQSDGRMQLHKS